MNQFLTPVSAAIALTACALTAQDVRPIAIQNARIVTISGDIIESGTVLITDGRIKAVGAKVKVPAGAERIDANGGTLMPGLVNAWSSAGLSGKRRQNQPHQVPTGRFPRRRPSRNQNPVNKAGSKVAESLYARQDVFAEMLEHGVTTLAIAPAGIGLPGMAATVALDAETQENFIADDDAYLVVTCKPQSKTKKLLKSALDAGKKALEERKKPKEEPKPAKPAAAKGDGKKPDSKPSGGSDGKDKPKDEPEPKPKPKDEPKPEPKPTPEDEPKKDPKQDASKKSAGKPKDAPKKPEKKKDPNAEALADLLDGKRHAFVVASSAHELVHFQQAVDEHRFSMTLVVPSHSSWAGALYEQPKLIEELGANVLMAPGLATPRYTNVLHDPGTELRAAGIEVGYLIGDSKLAVRRLFAELLDLVRHGADESAVLSGVTSIPAKMLGVDRDVGTIEKGKRANLLLFSGDPFDPSSRLLTVFYNGKAVAKGASR